MDGGFGEVVGHEHELLEAVRAGLRRAELEGLAELGADEVEHGVVGGLAGLGLAFGGVADDAEGGLVGGDHDLGDA